MGTYLVRRLLVMIPTLFGITVISFIIMCMAPGDPVANQFSGGSAGQSNETREAYLIRKRDLNLDKPLVLNFHYFHDYTPDIHWAAYFLSRSEAQIAAELPVLAAEAEKPADSQLAAKVRFLRSLSPPIPDFKARLAKPERHGSLAKAITQFTEVFCEDTGANGVPAAIAILQDPSGDLHLRIGAVRCLTKMVVDPFIFTYSIHPSEAETPAVVGAWQLWWEHHQKDLQAVPDEARKFFDELMPKLTGAHDELFAAIEEIGDSDYTAFAPRYFAEKLLGDAPLPQRVAASVVLKQFFSHPLTLDVPIDASAADVAEASANWIEYYKLHQTEFEPSMAAKLWSIVADTQYAHMVVRLATFNFGRSTLKTREPVSERIWNAFVVSAPLMLMSELLIYLIAVPLGIVCGVYRNRLADRAITLALFVLYSIPGFIAGMLFLVFFCFGDYLRWFPMLGLHADSAQAMSRMHYLLDYAWHAFLPVICLSLFSLAAMAMYSRSAMLDVINQDYIRTARAKGLSGPTIVLKHALRNALIPILTLFANFLPAMLGGSILVEFLFDIPGMGRLSLNSLEQKDYPTLMALLYVEAIVVLVSFLITDFLYVIVDPRIHFGGRGKSA